MSDLNWVWDQTNAALSDWEEVEHAYKQLVKHQFVLHPDGNKNWDNYIAIKHALGTTQPETPVLDAGAGDESAFLPSLQTAGYTNLLGINLDRKDDYTAGVRSGIRYAYGDITNTPFPNEIFPFIACLSVIEHGVDVDAFLREMARIITYGGHLFISFDYWKEKINTDGLVTHDAPINIFSDNEVQRLLFSANKLGLNLIGHEWGGNCVQPVIQWASRGYTFGNVLLRKLH